MKIISIEKRGKDCFYAFAMSDQSIYGSGITPQAAIGNLVYSHQEFFDISEIKYPRLKGFSPHLAPRNAREKRGR